QMLWAARGYFDRAGWLLDLQMHGPTLPVPVHRLAYTMAEEMRQLRERQTAGKNALLENVSPEERVQLVEASRSFQPADPDWAYTSLIMRLRLGGVDLDNIEKSPLSVEQIVRQNEAAWLLVAQHNPVAAARLHPDPRVRAAAEEVGEQLHALAESRGAYGSRDLDRLAKALAGAGLYAEALLTNRRAAALRGFPVPSDLMDW